MSKLISLPSKIGEPLWEIAELYPNQGAWSIEDYFRLDTNRLVEFSDGLVEFLAFPSQSHQLILIHAFFALDAFVQENNLGWTLFAPLCIRLNKNLIRQPDIVFRFTENDDRRHEQYWDGADLVMEVVSPDDPKRDTVQKRSEYAQAGIPEYWIVNPLDQTITVLTLVDDQYEEAQISGRGTIAKSVLLNGFEADTSAVFDSPK